MLKKCLTLLTALMLLLGTTAAFGQAIQDPVLATFEGQDILKSDVDAVIPMLEGYMTDATDYRYATEFVVQQRIIGQKIKDLGFDTFTAEEESAFKGDAQSQMDDGIESYISYYLSEDSAEAREQLEKQAVEFYAQQGMTLETLEENFRQSAAINKLSSYLVGDYEPGQEEIEATFNQFGASYQQNYENNILAYEYNTNYYQQPSWYTPEGYRGIVHILLQPESTLMEEYSRLSSAYEEQQSETDNELTQSEDAAVSEVQASADVAEPVTAQMVEDAKQAVLDAKKAEIDSIYEKLEQGESFESLIAQFGQDPGMQDENNLAAGYKVHKDSVIWDPAFTAGAFSDKMQTVGDVSDPVVGSNGIHILMYKSDVPSGLIMTDAIHMEIVEYLNAVKENSAMVTAIGDWTKDFAIHYNDDNILAATQSAQAMGPDDDADEIEDLQAVPMDENEPTDPQETEAPNDPNTAG